MRNRFRASFVCLFKCKFWFGALCYWHPSRNSTRRCWRCIRPCFSGLIVASKKLDSKIKKHGEIVAVAIAKRDSVRRLYSKALSDNQISDSEFQSIMAEFSQYNVLKENIRSKITRNSSQPDIEKIKKDVRSEVEVEFQKKNKAIVAGSN